MYKLEKNTLIKIEEIQTKKQKAIITTTVCQNVIRTDGETTIEFESIPEFINEEGKKKELHFDGSNLKWVYNEIVDPIQKAIDDYTLELIEGGMI